MLVTTVTRNFAKHKAECDMMSSLSCKLSSMSYTIHALKSLTTLIAVSRVDDMSLWQPPFHVGGNPTRIDVSMYLESVSYDI